MFKFHNVNHGDVGNVGVGVGNVGGAVNTDGLSNFDVWIRVVSAGVDNVGGAVNTDGLSNSDVWIWVVSVGDDTVEFSLSGLK